MKKRKGSFSLEATIVMSAIIFGIFAIISAFLLVYQNAVMYYVASQAAQEGAVMWTDMSHNLDGISNGEDSQSLYYRVGELFAFSQPAVVIESGKTVSEPSGKLQKKKYEIAMWADKKLKSLMPNTLIGSGKEKIEVQFHNYLVRQVVEVSITKDVNIPFPEIAQYFRRNLNLHVCVRASVADPAEGIRNIDYGYELLKTIWGPVKSKLSGLLSSKKDG